MNRRQFIERTGLAAVGAIAMPLLEACAPAAPVATTPASGPKAGSVFPAYFPFPNKPKPDYPSSGDPYLDGYDSFPANPARALSGEVGQGGIVSAMTIGLFPPPSPFENNPAWQEINKRSVSSQDAGSRVRQV